MDSDVPLIGRSAELAELRQAAESALTGRGTAVLMTGEAGIGKTRLLTETRRTAEATGLVVFRGRAAESAGAYRLLLDAFVRPAAPFATDPALAAVRPALARILPGYGEPAIAAPLADPNAVLAEALLTLIQVIAPRGALLLFDDVQWADDDTVAVLASLVDSAEDLGVSLVLSAHGEPLLTDRFRSLVSSGSLRRLPLRRLAPADVRAALPSLGFEALAPERLDQLVDLVDGLPVVLDDLRRQHHDGALAGLGLDPRLSGLAATTQRRYFGLDPNAQAVLDVLAVIEAPDPTLLSAVTTLDPAQLAAALHAGLDATLLVSAVNPLGVGWRHSLVRAVVSDRLLPLERRELARVAAEQLTEVLARSPSEDGHRQAADLWELAGFPERAAQHLVHAARAAVRSAAVDVAARDLTRAHSLAGAMPSAALDVLVEWIQTMTLAGRAVDGFRSGVVALSTAAGRGHRQLRFVTARAGYVARLVTPARQLAAELLADRSDPESALLAVYDADRTAAAISSGQRAAELAEDHGRIDLACEALLLAGRAARRHAAAGAEELLRGAIVLSERHELPVWRVMSEVELGNTEMLTRPAASVRFERARVAAVEAGMAGMLATIDTRLGEVTVGSHGYRAAYPYFAGAETQARQLGLVGAHTEARTRLADCLVWTEGHALPGGVEVVTSEAVDRAVAETVEVAGQSAIPPYARYVLGNRAWLNGDDEGACLLLMDSLRYMDNMVKVIPWWGVGRLLSVVQGADPDEAFGAVDRLGHAINRAAWAYGQLSRAVSRSQPYRPLLSQAESYLAGSDFLRHVLHTMMAPTLYRVDEDLAIGWLREADAFCDAAEERTLQRRVRTTMVELGCRVPRIRGSGVPPHLARLGLTARESEIHALLITGATNAEIGEQLVISVRTVESHVSNMLAKTGTTSRNELRSIGGPVPTSRSRNPPATW